ncbi:MAG: hypothetical protein ACJ8H8_00015 [Geminicoccaceae bacterium]
MSRHPSLGSSTTVALALFAALGVASAAYAAEPQKPTPDQQSGCTMRNGVAIGAGCGSTGASAAQGGVPGQAGKLGTSATGGVPGATAASGTQGGPAPDRSKPSGGSTEGQGVAAMKAKAGTGATGGAPGAAAAAGTEGGCPPDKSQPSGGPGGAKPDQAAATPSTC